MTVRLKVTFTASKNTYRSSFSGFTVVEIVIAVSIIGILIAPVSMIMMQFYGQAIASSKETQLAIDSNNTLSVLTEDIRVSSGVKVENSLADTNEPSGGWITDPANRMLVMSTPSLNTSRKTIVNPSTGLPYQDEIIYYISNEELRKRYLANTSAANNRARTTCPPESTTSTCPEDIRLSTNTKSFTFELYDAANVVTLTPSNTRSLKITTTMSIKSYGREISYADTAQIAIRNAL